MGSCVSRYSSRVQREEGANEMPAVSSLPPRLQEEITSAHVKALLAIKDTTRLAVPSEGRSRSCSQSPASSTSSATYSNLGQSRASIAPIKQPRNPKAPASTLVTAHPGSDAIPLAAPPLLPRRNLASTRAEPSVLATDMAAVKDEIKHSGTNLIMANPLYDPDSTWETVSQSSFLSYEAQTLGRELPESLHKPAVGKGRTARSLSSLVSPSDAPVSRDEKNSYSTESLLGGGTLTGKGWVTKPQKQPLYHSMNNWEEVVRRIRGLHRNMLRKLAGKCEERFTAGKKDHLRFGTDNWSDFRLTSNKPCSEAGDAVYYPASYAKDPGVSYAIKVCRFKATQQRFTHSLTVTQILVPHYNIQQDCGHFFANLPACMLPWEDEEEEPAEEDEADGSQTEPGEKVAEKEKNKTEHVATGRRAEEQPRQMEAAGKRCSRLVVVTQEVPFQTVADFVQMGASRHAQNPDLYERQVCMLLLQLCMGLEHMKPYQVVHCNLRLENLLLVPWQPGLPQVPDPDSACPARLLISNFLQAKLKKPPVDRTMKDQSRLAPESITLTQYKKCDEFQTGILIYEMLHRLNPFKEIPELKEKGYTSADLPLLPALSLYSKGLQLLAILLLSADPSDRIEIAEARAYLQCLLWGPREDIFQELTANPGPGNREAILQNWLDLKQTLMMIKFAERSLDSGHGVSLEDWLCCQYLAFSTTDTLSQVVKVFQRPPPLPRR